MDPARSNMTGMNHKAGQKKVGTPIPAMGPPTIFDKAVQGGGYRRRRVTRSKAGARRSRRAQKAK